MVARYLTKKLSKKTGFVSSLYRHHLDSVGSGKLNRKIEKIPSGVKLLTLHPSRDPYNIWYIMITKFNLLPCCIHRTKSKIWNSAKLLENQIYFNPEIIIFSSLKIFRSKYPTFKHNRINTEWRYEHCMMILSTHRHCHNTMHRETK